MARLIRLAGRREPPEAHRSARVRAALHAHWRREVSRRRRARMAWLGSAAAAAALAGWLVLPPASREPAAPPLAAGPAFRVESILGTATAHLAGSAAGARGLHLERGSRVGSGQILRTGPEGRLSIVSESGPSVRLDVGTTVRLDPGPVLALERGTVYLDTGPGRAGGAVLLPIETPFGRIHHIGTQLEARVRGGTLRLRVREGIARIEGRKATQIVRHGSQIELDAGGRISEEEIPTSGAEWSWIESVTRMPEVEGKTLRSFLDWVIRERGWRLAFASEEIERSAGRILLSGSLEGLTIDEGLDAVLPTCEMTWQVQGDLIVIRSAAGAERAG